MENVVERLLLVRWYNYDVVNLNQEHSVGYPREGDYQSSLEFFRGTSKSKRNAVVAIRIHATGEISLL